MSTMPKMGLVLQGGGALGAYEYGAVTRLIELGWEPVAVTGVSIGAATAAAIGGARDGDICASLKNLWAAITLSPVPFWPADKQATFSIFGNPNFWQARNDLHNYTNWTSLYDVSPMRETLAKVCDFDRLNDASKIRIAVTATNVQTGDQVSFSNYVGNPDFDSLCDAEDQARALDARSHPGKWQFATRFSNDGYRWRSVLGRRLV